MKSFKEIAINESAPKMVWKGGCSAPKIELGNIFNPKRPGGRKGSCANCGAHFEYKGFTFEAMSKEYSTHPTNIISLYIDNDDKKAEISGWLKEEDEGDYSKMTFGIAHYSDHSAIQSSKYSNKIAKKWDPFVELVREAHKAIFNGAWGINR